MRPDVVLIDLRMPLLDGIAATRQIVGAPGAHSRVLPAATRSLIGPPRRDDRRRERSTVRIARGICDKSRRQE